jgi:hypothetical protein
VRRKRAISALTKLTRMAYVSLYVSLCCLGGKIAMRDVVS